MVQLLLLLHVDKQIPINDIGGTLVFSRESDKRKFLIYEISDPFEVDKPWGEQLLAIRARYYSALALDSTKRGIDIKVLP